MQKTSKGFTLIELIITISILAILVTVLVIAINPAEQLARSRDAKRVADLDALKSAVNLYLAQATTTINLTGESTYPNERCKGESSGAQGPVMFATWNTATTTGASTTFVAVQGSSTPKQGILTTASNGSSTIDGITWFPVLLGNTPGGSPISNVPIDPSNGATYYYMYACDVTGGVKNFELNATLESTYFKTDLNVDGTDGGDIGGYYEVGNDPNLDLL